MNCREFKSNHVGFVDDLLSAAQMLEMRRHLSQCRACATLDVRIRRSLLVVRNLPEIQPSDDFFARLSEALRQSPPIEQKRSPFIAAATFTAVTAAIAAAVYFVMAIAPQSRTNAPAAPAANVSTVSPPAPMSEATIAASAPAGVPVWPAMFMVGELPAHFANAELLDTSLGR